MSTLDVTTVLSDQDLHRLFDARTVSAFEDAEVTAEQRTAIHRLMSQGPTAFNSQPLRVVWVPQGEKREQLAERMSPHNGEKTLKAPATAILAVDPEWHHKFAKFSPARPESGKFYEGKDELAAAHGQNNAFIQVGYFVMAVRAVGLDAGPMTGFDAEAVDRDLLADLGLHSIVVVNVGRGIQPEYPRNPRYTEDEGTFTI